MWGRKWSVAIVGFCGNSSAMAVGDPDEALAVVEDH